MKNLLTGLSLAATLFIASAATAQQMQMRSPQEKAKRQTEWMQKNLGLTDSQQPTAYSITLKYAQQMEDLRNAGAGADRRQGMMDIQAKKDAELKNLLLPEQFQKYQAHEQEMKERMQQRRSERMQNGGGN